LVNNCAAAVHLRSKKTRACSDRKHEVRSNWGKTPNRAGARRPRYKIETNKINREIVCGVKDANQAFIAIVQPLSRAIADLENVKWIAGRHIDRSAGSHGIIVVEAEVP